MKIDLAAQARNAQKVKRKKTIELPAFNPTRAMERELAQAYLKVFRVWVNGLRDNVLPEYRRSLKQAKQTQDTAADLEFVISRLENGVLAAIFQFRKEVAEWLSRINLRHMDRIISSLRYSTNVDLSTQLTRGDVAMTIEDLLARNVALVRNVSDQARGRISDIVFRGLQNRTPIRTVARELNQAIALGWERSLRIASDQTIKAAAALDRERQEQLGMTSFEWVHSGKTHFRPEHKARNGQVFKWNSEVGRNDPPGFAPFCGCKAKGVLEI